MYIVSIVILGVGTYRGSGNIGWVGIGSLACQRCMIFVGSWVRGCGTDF